jgi:hypothetical protein
LWTPYPADLKSVVLPKVVRTSKAGWGSYISPFLTLLISFY